MDEAQNSDNGPIPQNDELSSSPAKACALCGCSTPAVRCDRCSSQTFCLSCDDMYHRHPKRRLHLRKAVDSIWNTARSPRIRRRTDLPGDPSKIPIPPPRSKKRERHTIGGRMFLKSSHELGSFGHSKVFDIRSLTPPSKDIFAGQKSPSDLEATYENETNFPAPGIENMTKAGELYENENVPLNNSTKCIRLEKEDFSDHTNLIINVNRGGTTDDSSPLERNPWNVQRTNISSPIQVSIPSSSPDLMANGQSFGYPLKPQSRSIADLTGAPTNPIGAHPYHLPHYHYMHPPFPPQYSHSMAHLNCAQCISSSWSNLMSPHPSPYFHPMPWGSAQGSLARGHAPPAANGHLKHSHGNLPSYPDQNFPYPYPGGPYYPNGAPVIDPNFVRDLHQHADGSKVRKSPSTQIQNSEDMDTTAPEAEATNAEGGTATNNSINEEKRTIDDPPLVIPPPPAQPWSCLHCTYVNPPGSHICEVCCKTSYGNKSSAESDNQNESRCLDSRNSNSSMELVNLDAISKSPDFSEHKAAQKAEDSIGEDSLENENATKQMQTDNSNEILESSLRLCTETQTFTTTKSTDVQTQNLICKSMASSTDSIFPKQEMSVQTETEAAPKNCSVATDPMISSQSMESLLSGISAPPYHNRRAGWGRGTSFSTQSLYERGRSRSPIPRSLSMYNEAHSFGRDSSLPSEEAMHSWSQAWLMSDPMYYKPHNLPGLGQTLVKEDYFDGTWGSMDKLNRRVKNKQGEIMKAHQKPKLHRSLDDLKAEKTQDVIHSQELQFLQTVKEAERCGFSLEDLHVAYLHCGRENPVFWLEDNWSSMIKNVIALAAKYGEDNEENDVGVITTSEAKEALHIHRGDIWDAVTECIENRQRKILELTVRGNFTQKQISDALKNNDGNVELAYADLLRATSRRHKFILSPGLSEDSEDLTLYNPVDDSTTDRPIGTSPSKAPKLDIPADSKTDKKKSDFLTKLSAIRQAQSERRKAREEKEMFRETTVQELPSTVEAGVASPPIDQEDEAKVVKSIDTSQPELSPEALQENIEKGIIEAELDLDLPHKDSVGKREGTEDNIPVDYDTNWTESQGEWIEEYSDEQWDEESDGQWIALQKKYQKMEKEFEEEAMQMAALWEKEELEDDVFEEEPKVVLQSAEEAEAERLKAEQDEKFQQWVKVNLEKSLSEPEDNEINEGAITSDLLVENPLSKSVEFDANIVCESPLQHYPTAFDLSAKSEPDWVELGVSVENQALSNIESHENEELLSHKFEDQEHEVKTVDENLNVGNSDDEWEKIDENELLELKHEEELISSTVENPEQSYPEEPFSELVPDESNIHASKLMEEIVFEEIEPPVPDKTIESTLLLEHPSVGIGGMKSEEFSDISSDVAGPKPPVRRKSKLNTAAIEEVLRNQPQSALDVPPALPPKNKDKSPDKNAVNEVYAVPEKHHKDEKANSTASPAPLKPPRLNLSPSPETKIPGLSEIEADNKKLLNVEFSKEASPATSLSNESDSNCFADSESDPEIKIIRQKYMHHKPAKYENEDEDLFEESCSKLEDVDASKSLRHAVEEAASASQGFDFNPELPLPLGSRGSRVVDEMASPKAFREGSARPLQLFKVSKQEPPPAVKTETTNVENDVKTSTISKATEENTLKYIPENIQPQQEVLPNETETVILTSDANMRPLKTDSYYYNIDEIEHAPDIESSTRTMEDLQENFKIQSQPMDIVPIQFQETIPEAPLQLPFQEKPMSKKEESAFNEEIGGMFAAAEYFFGRYDEVVVAKPKKKTASIKPTQQSNKSIQKAATASNVSKTMSTSEMRVSSGVKSPSPMEISASPVMMSNATPEDKPVEQPRNVQISPGIMEIKSSPPVVPKEPAPTEYISFAEDYFFGSYNEVVVPKKVLKKPLASIPKLKGTDKSKTSDIVSSHDKLPNKMISTASSVETNLSGVNQTNLSMTTSLPEVLHSESTDLYFDANTLKEQISLLPEILEQSEDTIPVETDEVDRKLDSKVKSVHFEAPQPVIVPPPRKNRSKPESNASTVSSHEEEHRYLEQYDSKLQSGVMDKKKLPPCSEDFKMIQGCDPSNLPSNSLLSTIEQQESAVSSEISLHTSKESLNVTKDTLKMKEMENVDPQVFEVQSTEEVIDFSHCSAKYQDTSVSSEGAAAAESDSQPTGGLFKIKIHTHLSENSELSNVPKDQASEEQYEMFEAISPTLKDTSTVKSNYEPDQQLFESKITFDDIQPPISTLPDTINEQSVRENPRVSDISSTVSEDISATCVASEHELKLLESTVFSDDQLQVPRLSSIIEKQGVPECTKIPEVVSDISKDTPDTIRMIEQDSKLPESEQNFEAIQSHGSEISCSIEQQASSTMSDIPSVRFEGSLSLGNRSEQNQEFLEDKSYSNAIQAPELFESDEIKFRTLSGTLEDASLVDESTFPDQELQTEESNSDLVAGVSNTTDIEDEVGKLIRESFSEKLESEPSVSGKGVEYDDEDYEMQFQSDSKLEDDYSSLQLDEEFEAGLRLVEDTENLINELCDIYPQECFEDSSNEIRNLNTKNNNQDSTYDSEYEWKLNEEHYNSLNASFIENKAYKPNTDSAQSPVLSKNSLIIDTNVEENKENDIIPESRKSVSSLADISEISELLFEGEESLAQSVSRTDVAGEDNVSNTIQPLSVLCQTAASISAYGTSAQSTSFELSEIDHHSKDGYSEVDNSNQEGLDALNEGSDDSLVTSTHSSVATQIAVFADTLLQDVADELSIPLDSKSIGDVSCEKSGRSPNIPFNLTDEIETVTDNIVTDQSDEDINKEISDIRTREPSFNILNSQPVVETGMFQEPATKIDYDQTEVMGVGRILDNINFGTSEVGRAEEAGEEIHLDKTEEISLDTINMYSPDSNDNRILNPECTETAEAEKDNEYPEDSSLSLMSHFYDEWIENVKISETYPELQQDFQKLYLRYDDSELTSSGSASENEDFAPSSKSQDLDSYSTCFFSQAQFEEYVSSAPNGTESTPDESSKQEVVGIVSPSSYFSNQLDEYESLNPTVTEVVPVTPSEQEVIDTEDKKDLSLNIAESFKEIHVDDSLDYYGKELVVYSERIQDTESITKECSVDETESEYEVNVFDEILKQTEVSIVESFDEKIYSTSKSCQTDDSFEEDQFFDSFDDPSIDPSFMLLPVFKTILPEPVKTEIGIQCCLISSETSISPDLVTDTLNLNEDQIKILKEKDIGKIKVLQSSVAQDDKSEIDISDSSESKLGTSDGDKSNLFISDKLAISKTDKSKLTISDVDKSKLSISDADESKLAISNTDKSKLAISDVDKSKLAISDVDKSKLNISDADESKLVISDVDKSKLSISDADESKLTISDTGNNFLVLPESLIKSKEDSSSESTEDTDSDIFLEPYSSHDEYETDSKTRCHFLSDSDTGFSSGSESGRRSSKQKPSIEESKNASKSIYDSVEISNGNVDGRHKHALESIEDKILEVSTYTLAETDSDTSTCPDNVEPNILSRKEIIPAQNKIKPAECKSPDVADKISLPQEIVERAVTPISIKRVPSIESDLTFVDIENYTNEQVIESVTYEKIIGIPTVEYFYGPLPQTVQSEIPHDSSECFVEAIDLLDACASEVEKNILENSLSTQILDPNFSLPSDKADAEDLSESLVSFHDPEDDLLTDSISDYFPVSDIDEVSVPELQTEKNEVNIATKLQNTSTPADSSSSVFFESDKTASKINQKTELKDTSVVEPSVQQELARNVSTVSLTSDICEKTDKKEIETRSAEISVKEDEESDIAIESETKYTVVESKTESGIKYSSSEQAVSNNLPDITPFSASVDTFDERDKISDGSEFKESIYSDTVSECSPPADFSVNKVENLECILSSTTAEEINTLKEDERKGVTISEFEKSLYSERIPDYFSVVESSSNEPPQTVSGTESLCMESMSEYFSSKSGEVNIEPKSDVTENITALQSTQVVRDSDFQEIESSIYEISDDHFEYPVDLQTHQVSSGQSEIPPVPSDIIRYLYYDDSIKFEDEPSICDESYNSVESSQISELRNITSDVSVEPRVVDQEEPSKEFKPLETDHISERLDKGRNDDIQTEASTEIDLSLSKSDKSDHVSQTENIVKENLDKSDSHQMEVSTFGSASVSENNDDQFEDPASLTNSNITSTHPEIPSKPSDIVRYLYYDDSIKFEEDSSVCDESFNSLHSFELSPLLEPVAVSSDKPSKNLIADVKELPEESSTLVKAIASDKPEQRDKSPQPQLENVGVTMSLSKSEAGVDESVHSFISEKDQFESVYSESGSAEQWFDLEASKSSQLVSEEVQMSQDSDDLTETRSTTKDGDLPCVAEMSVEKGSKSSLPIAAVDSDEVTDISTHFTMTEDDSDKFSDIESDSSLNNFDEDVILSIDRNKNENLNLEISKPFCSEGSKQDSLEQGDSWLDENANKDDDYAEECATPVEFSEDMNLIQDVEASLRDVNGNLKDLISNAKAYDTVENILSASDAVCDASEEQSVSVQTAECDGSLSEMVTSGSISTDICKDEFFDVSQTEDSLSISKTGEIDNWSDAKSANLTKTDELNFRSSENSILETVSPFKVNDGSTSSNELKEDTSCFVAQNEQMVDSCDTKDSMPAPAKQKTSFTINIESGSTILSVESEEVVCTDKIIFDDESSLKEIVSTETLEDRSLTDLDATALSLVKKEVGEVGNISDIVVNVSKFASEENIKMTCTIEQKDEPEEVCRAFYETKEKDPDVCPKVAEFVPSPVSDVSGTECIPNFGIERKTSLSLDENVCLKGQTDFSAQLKTASSFKDDKFRPSEIDFSKTAAPVTDIVHFRGIITDSELLSEPTYVESKTVSNSESIEQLEPEHFKSKTKENEVFDFKIDVSEISVDSSVQNIENISQEIEAKEIEISGRVDQYQDEAVYECVELSVVESVKESEISQPKIDISKLSVSEGTQEDTYTVDFKGIVLHLTEVSNLQKSGSEEKDGSVFDSIKQQQSVESIQESEISQSKTVFSEVAVSEVIEQSTCAVDFRGISLDSEEVSKQQQSSSESKNDVVPESIEQQSVFKVVKEVSQSKIDVPEVSVLEGTNSDTYVVDFRGIILDSEEVSKQQQGSIGKGIGVVPESIKQQSIFEAIQESEISQSKIGISEVDISERAELDICAVDFKGIITDFEVVNKEEASSSENQIMGISGSTEKQIIEPIVEPVLKTDMIPHSELSVSRVAVSEEDEKGDYIVDFKGIVLDSEFLINQQKFSTEDKIISSSKSPKHFEQNVVESVTTTDIDVSKTSQVSLEKTIEQFSQEKSIEEKGSISIDHVKEMNAANFKEIPPISEFPVSSDIPGCAVAIKKDFASSLETDENRLVSDYKLDTVQAYTNALSSASDETTESYGTVTKDEVTDTSYHSLSEESDNCLEDDGSSSFKDFTDYSIPKPQIGLVDASAGFAKTISDSVQKGVSDLVPKEVSTKESSMQKKLPCILKAHEEPLTSDVDSSYFHSAHEDKESASVITSDDDFTDVPSHITLTEDSDTWSDVDTSIGIEDLDQDSFNMMKEKTPTRDENEFVDEDAEPVNQDVPHNLLSKKTEQDESVVKEDVALISNVVDPNLHHVNELTEGSKDEPAVSSDDNTDVASFNSITDECETWSDNEITASLTDYVPPSFDKKEIISSEMNVDKSIELNSVTTAEAELPHSLSEKVDVPSTCTTSGVKVTSDQTSEASAASTLFDTLTSEEVLLDANKHPTDLLPEDSTNLLFLQDSLQTRKSSDSDDKNMESDIHKDSSDLSYGTVSKEEYVEKFSDLETENSEMSTSSFFETISKDDDSEKFSDSGSENFREYESTLSALEKHEEPGFHKFISKEVCSKKSDKEDESSEIATIDILPEPVPLVVDKKALSLSIADIVESSEVDVKCDQTTEPLILEHYADVKSLSQQVALVENLSACEVDAGVSKTHKETTDSSVGAERAEESDYCLGTETEFSVSEFEDEAVSFSEKEKTDPFPPEILDTSGISEDKLNNFKTTSEMSTENVTGISVSFSTDTDYSDQVSDTYADISLQGGTTENSDKWSDFEGEGTVDVLEEHVQMIDNEEFRNRFDFSLGIEHESAVPCKNTDPVNKQSSHETDSEIMLAGTLENSSKISKTIGTIEGSKQKEPSSFPIDREIKTESKTNEMLSVSSEKLLDTASRMSDDEFTSVTPMDVTVEESDKWSDISDDTSVEEIPDSSKSVSLKRGSANLNLSDIKSEDSVDDSIGKVDEKLDINVQSENQSLGLIESSETDVSKEPPEKSDPKIISTVESTTLTSDIISEPLLLTDIQEEAAGVESVDCCDTGRGQFESSVEEDLLNRNITCDSSNVHPSPIYENDDEHFEDDEYPEEYDPNFDQNELDEEDYNSGSVPYILNDDELVYPLQYGEDWIEESFDLKEYGIEAAFSGSETDVHGLNINDEYDEDIQRAIDMNLSNFEEAIESFMDDQNLATESFKTLSNNTPTQSKLTDKEHDSWSTADADSIEDDLSDHDDVLSKIDEILAEDFGYSKIDYFSDEESSRAKKVIEENIQCQTDTVDVLNRETLETPTFSSISERHAVAEKNDVFDGTSPQKGISDDSKDFPKPETVSCSMSSSKIPLKSSYDDGTVEDSVDNVQVSTDKIQKATSTDTEFYRASVTDSVTENLHITDNSAETEEKGSTAGILKDIENTVFEEKSQEITSLETTKMNYEALETKELSKDVSEIPSKSGSEKLSTVTSKAAEVNLSPKENIVPTEAVELKLSSKETSMASEKTMKLKPALDESFVASEEAVKLKLSPKETTLTPVQEIKVKLPSEQTSIASDETFIASEKTVKLKSTVEQSSVTSQEAVKLELSSKETALTPTEEMMVKLPSEQTSIASDETSKASEQTVKLKSTVEQSSVASETVKLKLSSKETVLIPAQEMMVKLTSEQTSIASDETFIASEKTVKLKSTVEQSSVASEEAVKLKLSSKETALTPAEEMMVKLPSEQTSIASDETFIVSEKTVKLKSTVEQSTLASEAVKLKLLSEGTTLTPDEEMMVKLPSEKTSIASDETFKSSEQTVKLKSTVEQSSVASEETVKLKSTVEQSSVSSEEAVKLKLSPKETALTPAEEMMVKLPSEQTSIASDETSKASEQTVRLKSTVEQSSLASEEAVKLKLPSKETILTPAEEMMAKLPSEPTSVASDETSMVPEKTMKLKSSVKESYAASESVKLKSSLEEGSVASEEAVKLKLSSKETTQIEEMKVKSPSEQISIASGETFISEKTGKLKSSLEESSVASEEALKLSLKEITSSSTEEMKVKLPSQETIVVSTEAAEVKPDIPLKKKRAMGMSEYSEQFRKVSLSETDSDSSLSSSSESTSQQGFKPDIPDKTKRRCRPKPETTSDDQEQFAKAPALPRKRPKRESSSESISSSVFLSSSSESLSSYESAPLKESSKSDTSSLKTSPSASADVPEVPARKARVKSSSIRERRRDSAEDSSSASSISESSRRSYDLPQKEAMDLCRKRTSIDVRMIKLQNEGKCSTKEKAFIAAKLIEMQFEEEDALLASRQCNSVYHAIKFLTQLCELCNCRFPVNLMTSMFHCTHRACKECLKAHFTSLIYDRSVFTLLCPICHKPDITDQNIQEYFNHLEMMFRNLLAGHVYDLFQRKLRDEVLTKDPNFHWCSQCSSGFIASPRLKKLYCPDCSAITCAMCHQTWELEHEGVHCERFQQWKDMHTPEPPPAGLVKYLTDRGVTCSSCDLKFDQACGGSLHYKCCHCSFEFCGFCSQPYKRGKECGDENCEPRGLHAHHPYSCLFFLRDIEISDLQMLLEEESVTYLTIPPKDQIVKSRCQVREQKHIHGSRSEDRCGRDIVPYCAGLCRTHYYEYLAELLRKNKINPLSVMTTQDLQFILRKSRVMVPDRIKGETNEDYYKRLTKVVSSTLT